MSALNMHGYVHSYNTAFDMLGYSYHRFHSNAFPECILGAAL